jgi:hypothetical protein
MKKLLALITITLLLAAGTVQAKEGRKSGWPLKVPIPVQPDNPDGQLMVRRRYRQGPL